MKKRWPRGPNQARSPYESVHPRGRIGRPRLVYISTGQTDPKIRQTLMQRPNYGKSLACDMRAQRSRALARNHIIHIISYHTNHIVPSMYHTNHTVPYCTIRTIQYHIVPYEPYRTYYMYNKFCPSTIPCTLESFCLSVNSSRWNCDGER